MQGATVPRSDFYGWKLLAAFWLVLFVNLAFPAYGSGVINTYMAEDLHLSRQMVGLPYSVYLLMSGLPGPIAALIVNRRGIRFAIALGGGLVMAGSLAMALFVSSGAGAVLAFGFVVGGGVAIGGAVATQTGVARWFVRRRSLALAILLSGGGFGGFAASRLLDATIRAAHGNWRAGWWLVLGLSFLATLIGALCSREHPQDLGQQPDGGPARSPQERPRDRAPPRASEADATGAGPPCEAPQAPALPRLPAHVTTETWSFGEAIRTPALWGLFAGALGVSAAFAMLIAHGGEHLKDLGHPISAAALAISTMTLSSLLAKAVVAALGDRIDPRYIWAAFTAICGVGVALAIGARSTLQLYLFALCIGSGFGGMMVCLMAVLSNYYGLKAYASIVGLAIAIQTTVSSIAPYVAGLLYDRTGTYTVAFYFVAAVCFAGAAILLLIRPPRRGRGAVFAGPRTDAAS